MIYTILKFFLFQFSAERAHHITMTFFGTLAMIPLLKHLIKWVFSFEHSNLSVDLWGLSFKNPVGLAAGFDKDGKYIKSMSLLGFGFIEVGTVTPKPQKGNPKPRLFRLIKDEGIINRMGFNNEGVDILVERLKKLKKREIIIGGNIGKNKDTPNENAFSDYLICFKKLYPYVDYFVVNISSPNTPGLRSLQEREPLQKILAVLLDYRKTQLVQRPILLKIAPDLSPGQLFDVVDIVEKMKIEGIIATNTTIAREPLVTDKLNLEKIGSGGLSGRPLQRKSSDVIKSVSRLSTSSLPLIGVGGINSALSAKEKMQAGAKLIQIYSGLIYEGPFLVKRIKKHLAES